MIGIAAAKFLLLGLIVSNYSTIFRNVNGAFNQVAATISPNDWANNWMLQVNQYFNGLGNTNWFNLVVSSIVALVSVLVQLVAAVVLQRRQTGACRHHYTEFQFRARKAPVCNTGR